MVGAGASAEVRIAPWGDAALPVREGLELWFDATRENEARVADSMSRLAEGGRVEIWHDASGYGRDLAQWTDSARPTWNGQAFEFDGNDYLASLVRPGVSLKDATVFVVAFVPSQSGDFPALLSAARFGGNDYTADFASISEGSPRLPG